MDIDRKEGAEQRSTDYFQKKSGSLSLNVAMSCKIAFSCDFFFVVSMHSRMNKSVLID